MPSDFQNFFLPVLKDKGISTKDLIDRGLITKEERRKWLDFFTNDYPSKEKIKEIGDACGLSAAELKHVYAVLDEEEKAKMYKKMAKGKLPVTQPSETVATDSVKKRGRKTANTSSKETSLIEEVVAVNTETQISVEPVAKTEITKDTDKVTQKEVNTKMQPAKKKKNLKDTLLSDNSSMLVTEVLGVKKPITTETPIEETLASKKEHLSKEISCLFDSINSLMSDIVTAENSKSSLEPEYQELVDLARKVSSEDLALVKGLLKKLQNK